MTLNHGMPGTTKYNSQIDTSTPTPDPYTSNRDIGVARGSFWLERIARSHTYTPGRDIGASRESFWLERIMNGGIF